MIDYWGAPEKDYELSLLQFAEEQMAKMGYTVLSEKVEVCSGSGALTLTAIIKANDFRFGLYLHDGPKQRRNRDYPIIKVLGLLPEMQDAEDLRGFILTHANYFHKILTQNTDFTERAVANIRRVYALLYNSKIKDLYDSNLSSAADVLRVRLRKK